MFKLSYLIAMSLWWSTFFYCLQQCETANEKDPTQAIGDNGDSIGPYQIQHDYWLDATEYDKTIGGNYEDCKQFEYSERIIKAYMERYAFNKGIYEPVKMARIHSGGPLGGRKRSTEMYGNKFHELWKDNFISNQSID